MSFVPVLVAQKAINSLTFFAIFDHQKCFLATKMVLLRPGWLANCSVGAQWVTKKWRGRVASEYTKYSYNPTTSICAKGLVIAFPVLPCINIKKAKNNEVLLGIQFAILSQY